MSFHQHKPKIYGGVVLTKLQLSTHNARTASLFISRYLNAPTCEPIPRCTYRLLNVPALSTHDIFPNTNAMGSRSVTFKEGAVDPWGGTES